MGLQVRKRTKGKTGWVNGSYSSRGAGASGSVKISKNVTYNTGDILNDKTKPRITFNLGNGVRYVKYAKSSKNNGQHPASSLLNGIIGLLVLVFLLVIGTIIYTLLANFFWYVVGVVAILVFLYILGSKND